MSDYLFAYGTLQPGLAPASIAPAVARLVPVGEATVLGTLYDLGGHPGAVLEPNSKSKIFGAVYQLPDDASVLAELDSYEDFNPASPKSSLFVRVLHMVEMAAGGKLVCWVYLYNRDPGSASIIPGGNFRKCALPGFN